MRHSFAEHVVIGGVVLSAVVWLDLLSLSWLGQVMRVLLAWSLLSTAMVATGGAWVALGRSRRRLPRRQITSRRLPRGWL
jgi:uncharacterized membrane protein YedE/YeeE